MKIRSIVRHCFEAIQSSERVRFIECAYVLEQRIDQDQRGAMCGNKRGRFSRRAKHDVGAQSGERAIGYSDGLQAAAFGVIKQLDKLAPVVNEVLNLQFGNLAKFAATASSRAPTAVTPP
jgi:hypothetical protein